MKSMRLIAECVLVAMAVLCAVSCEKEDVIETYTPPYKSKIVKMKFGHDAATEIIPINSLGTWSIEGTTSWCDAKLKNIGGENILEVSVTENQNLEIRVTQLKINLENRHIIINVIQNPIEEIVFDYKAGSMSFVSSEEMDWDMLHPSINWCAINKKDSVGKCYITISVSKLPTTNERTAQLRLKKDGALCEVAIVQRYYYVTISQSQGLYYSRAAQSDTLVVNCSGDNWQLRGEDTDWCTYSRESGRNGDKLIITLSENSPEEARQTTFTLTSGVASNTYNVYQYGIEPTPGQVVDLGLSVKWAGWNIGATKPEEIGDLFAWGETSTKTEYTQETYKYSEYNLYHEHWYWDYIDIGNNISGTRYDVARAKWKGDWRMPTKTEYEELFNNCESLWVTYKNQKGVMFTGKNGNKLFIPYEYYWTATASYEAYYLYIQIQPDKKLNFKCIYDNYYLSRYEGAPVRAVTD